jgi:hypothetical protein
MCHSNIVREFGGAEDFTLAEGGRGLEDTFGGVGAVVC